MNTKILKAAGFESELKQIKLDNCPFCRKPIVHSDFRNAINLREFEISRLCQACQDEFFGKD